MGKWGDDQGRQDVWKHAEDMTTHCYEKADGKVMWFATSLVGLTAWFIGNGTPSPGSSTEPNLTARAGLVALLGLFAVTFVLFHQLGGLKAHYRATLDHPPGLYNGTDRDKALHPHKSFGLNLNFWGLLVLSVLCAETAGKWSFQPQVCVWPAGLFVLGAIGYRCFVVKANYACKVLTTSEPSPLDKLEERVAKLEALAGREGGRS